MYKNRSRLECHDCNGLVSAMALTNSQAFKGATVLSRLCLFVCKVLLYHATNLAVSVEVLADHSFLVKGSSHLLSSASNGAVGYIPTVSMIATGLGSRLCVPLNILPTAPSLENMLVPVPEVFSPAEG